MTGHAMLSSYKVANYTVSRDNKLIIAVCLKTSVRAVQLTPLQTT